MNVLPVIPEWLTREPWAQGVIQVRGRGPVQGVQLLVHTIAMVTDQGATPVIARGIVVELDDLDAQLVADGARHLVFPLLGNQVPPFGAPWLVQPRTTWGLG